MTWPRITVKKPLLGLVALLTGALIAYLPALANDAPLDELRWKARVLLVFAADTDDSRVVTFTESINNMSCEVAQRDIVSGEILSTGESRIGDTRISADDAEQLRELFRVDDSDFRVFLVGKDGGVKATYTSVPALEVVFGLIDGMPMRIREARTQSKC